MPDMIVIKKPLYRDGREYRVGERFTASEVDAGHYMKRNMAEVFVQPKPRGRVAETKPTLVERAPVEVAAAPEPSAPVAESEPKADEAEATAQRGGYRTRRLKADD